MAHKIDEEQEAKEETLEQLGLRYLAAQEQRLRVCQREQALRDEFIVAMKEAGKEVLVIGPKALILDRRPGSLLVDVHVKDL